MVAGRWLVCLPALVLVLASGVAAGGNNGWLVNVSSKQQAVQLSMAVQSSGPNGPAVSSSLYDEWWINFKETFNRSYSNSSEESKAKGFFKTNMQNVVRINQDPSLPYWVTGNKWSDQDPERLKSLVMKFDPLNNGSRKLAEGISIPDVAEEEEEDMSFKSRKLLQFTVDWRTSGKVTSVKDQGWCGACWAYSATSAIESAYLIAQRTTASASGLSLSIQQLISCASNEDGYWSYGCDGGFADQAMKYVLNLNQTTEEVYETTNKATFVTRNCEHDLVASTQPGQTVRLGSGTPVYYGRNSERALRAAVARQPVVVYWHAVGDFYNYAGGIYSNPDCSVVPNHAMLAVGFSYSGDKTKDFWIVKNSWSTGWGMDGYIHIAMDGSEKGTCGLHVFNVAPSLLFTQKLGSVSAAAPPPWFKTALP